MHLKLLYSIIFTLFSFSTLFAQIKEVDPPDYIKTIVFKGLTDQSQLPIIKFGNPILLEFDVLNGDEDDYYYTIEHYNHDWTPSPLMLSEYMDGFNNQRIRYYENSFNTYQIYSNYRLSIPNEQTKRLKVSGNYLIKIHNSSNELVFSKKFMIYEDITTVGVNIKRSRDIQFIDEKQNVDISISSNSFQFNNPMETVKTVIVQNNNLKTALKNLKPQYTVGNKLIYKYDSESSFWGSNEFLYFENKNIRGGNISIYSISLEDIYHNYLHTNSSRANNPYTYFPDINGNFLTTALDVEDPRIEADYAYVHFSLLPYEDLFDKAIYVYGGFNNYAVTEATKMIYNEVTNLFETTLLLKQGFYNYKYIITDDKGNVDEGALCGDFRQTENNYKVIVYYRDLGARYDRIIGLGEASSVNLTN